MLSESEVRALLTPREAIEVVGKALTDLARGMVANPLRGLIRPDGATINLVDVRTPGRNFPAWRFVSAVKLRAMLLSRERER